MKLPKVIAHRGAPKIAPENTLAALIAAQQLGATWVECDVMLTQDQVPVIFHDWHLSRTTNGHGWVHRKSDVELRQLDAGQWFAEQYAGEKIPHLSEYLKTALSLGVSVNLELKAIRGSETPLAQNVLKTLREVWPQKGPEILLSSFSLTCLDALQRLGCRYRLAYNVSHWRSIRWHHAKTLQCYSIHLAHEQLNENRVATLKENGFHVLSYTVNDPMLAKRLFSWSVDGVFSDIPNLMPDSTF